MDGIKHFQVTAIRAVGDLMVAWPAELRDYITDNCYAVDVRRTIVTIFVTQDKFLIADLVKRVMETEGATKEVSDFGNVNFDFPGDPSIRIVL